MDLLKKGEKANGFTILEKTLTLLYGKIAYKIKAY